MDLSQIIDDIAKNGGKHTIVNDIRRFENERMAVQFDKQTINRQGDFCGGPRVYFNVELPTKPRTTK